MGKYADETIRIFIDESLEHLADIENELLAIEQCGADIDEKLVNKVYRAAHSIKGGAGFMGLGNIKNLTHEMENVLGKIRAREIVPDTSIINVLLLASDSLRNLINDIDNSDDADITEHLKDLILAMGGKKLPDQEQFERKELQPASNLIKVSFPDKKCAFSIPIENISNIRKEGKYLYLIEIDMIQLFKISDTTVSSVIDSIRRCGVILDSIPDILAAENFDPDKISDDFLFKTLFATVLKPTDVCQLIDSQIANIHIVNEDYTIESVDINISEEISAATSETEDTAYRAKEKSTEVSVPTDINAQINAHSDKTAVSMRAEQPVEQIKFQTSLRVNINLLDSLMTLAGELVLSRNQLLQAIIRNDRRALEISGQRIDLITSELQEAIMHTRMQPIQNIFHKYPRVVRDIAISLNKKINLSIEGKEVELDKSIIENLNDPMTHLIRNAADHGIELPETRTSHGKNPVGTINLKAYHEAGQVNIEIRDDGKGMDEESISESAIAKGLVSEEMVKDMSSREKINLIFLPGFSMSDEVTELSGRGVGMDVVKTNLDRLGGLVDIVSEPGKGSTIHIKLPLTLAIIPSLLISDGNERYAIPQANVVELLRIPPSQIKERIEHAGNARVVRLRDDLLPLMRLANVLAHEQFSSDQRQYHICKLSLFNEKRGVNIVVVSTGIFKYGMIVDELHDTEEIVVKPLGKHLKDCRGYAGATILGDGSVALILDVTDLARLSELVSMQSLVRESESKGKVVLPVEDQQTLLIFRNSQTTRFAVPLELVERIEKIRCQDIETAGGRRVIKFHESNMPLFDIGDVAQVDKFEEGKDALIIVFFVAGMDIGILAIPPIDSIRSVYKIDEATLKQPGISGSAVIDGKATLMVDVIGIIEAIHPEWFSVEKLIHQNGERKTIILAEDTKLFRNQIKCAIEDAGYNVIEAEDGMIAWDLLQKNADLISLVVTDLEMPNLDGFGFARKIKDDERFSHLPVIAVSSLAGKKDIKKAKISGVDEYQIKLDRKKLIGCINHYLENL